MPSLNFQRYFTKGMNPGVYNAFQWERTDVDITDDSGKNLFTQKSVEFPNHWSQLARKIAASKYFYGDQQRN